MATTKGFRKQPAQKQGKDMSATLKQDLIMLLSPELRNNIYELALVSNNTITINGRWKAPALLRVSKAIAIEAKSWYFKSNKFKVVVDHLSFERVAKFLTCTVRDVGERPFLQFHFFMTATTWLELHKVYELTKVIYQTGVQLPAVTFEGSERYKNEVHRQALTSLFEMSVYKQSKMQSVLEEAVALGVQARKDLGVQAEKDHPNQDELKKRFDSWYDFHMGCGSAKAALTRASREQERLDDFLAGLRGGSSSKKDRSPTAIIAELKKALADRQLVMERGDAAIADIQRERIEWRDETFRAYNDLGNKEYDERRIIYQASGEIADIKKILKQQTDG